MIASVNLGWQRGALNVGFNTSADCGKLEDERPQGVVIGI
jgi:hypothetical protein